MRFWPLLLAATCWAQNFTHRGFVDATTLLYPQTSPGDSGRVIGEGLLRYEAFYKAGHGLQFAGGIDMRTDTHRQTEREFGLSWQDRNLRRPAFAVRRLSASYNRGKLALELGKQFIRWGKADILNPTDRFAPRDFVNVAQTEFLAVTAARMTYGTQSDSVEVVWSPRFTPSRTPQLGQRWAPVPDLVDIRDVGARYPGGSQIGARYNHIGRIGEFSLSFYDGNNHLPQFEGGVRISPFSILLRRFYPQMRMYGGDAAIPTRWFTIKGEGAYFTTSTPESDEYALYVVQLERQAGEWFFVGGYAGEAVTERRSVILFAYDRGLARSFLGRAGYTIDTNRSIAVETAVRQNGNGMWTKFEYSHAFQRHWRATAGFTWIRGEPEDFLGQFRRSSHAILGLRYSF